MRGWVIGIIVAACVLLVGGAVAAVVVLRSHDGDGDGSALSTMTTRHTTSPTASSTIGGSRSWSIDRWELLLSVQPDSDINVEETVTSTFKGSFGWITRTLSASESVDIASLEVWQDGRQLPQGQSVGSWETYMDGTYRVVKVHTDVTDASKAWTFKYVARGVVVPTGEGGTDELTWYVFDDIVPIAVAEVSVTLRLPGAVAAGDMAADIQTGDGVQYEMDSPAPSTIVYTGSDVPANTEFWIWASFPTGVVAIPGD